MFRRDKRALIWNEDERNIINETSIDAYRQLVTERYPHISIQFDYRPLSDPTLHLEIFEVQKSILTELLENFDSDILINISSGTGAMHATWLIATGSI